MPHFDERGNEEWVCQAGVHVCTGPSHWVEGVGNCCSTHLALGEKMHKDREEKRTKEMNRVLDRMYRMAQTAPGVAIQNLARNAIREELAFSLSVTEVITAFRKRRDHDPIS